MRILANSSRIDSEVNTLGTYMSFPIHEYEFGLSIRLRLWSSSPMAFLIVVGYLPHFPGSRNHDVEPFGFLQGPTRKATENPWFGHVPQGRASSHQGKGLTIWSIVVAWCNLLCTRIIFARIVWRCVAQDGADLPVRSQYINRYCADVDCLADWDYTSS